jgi:hypothetical protein
VNRAIVGFNYLDETEFFCDRFIDMSADHGAIVLLDRVGFRLDAVPIHEGADGFDCVRYSDLISAAISVHGLADVPFVAEDENLLFGHCFTLVGLLRVSQMNGAPARGAAASG